MTLAQGSKPGPEASFSGRLSDSTAASREVEDVQGSQPGTLREKYSKKKCERKSVQLNETFRHMTI